MANEITGVVQVRCLNGNFDSGQQQITLQITQTTQGAISGIITPATTGTAFPPVALATNGIFLLRNLDASINVVFGSTLYEWTIKPGEPFLGRATAAAALSLKAASGSPKVSYLCLND
jgi:hypothetical protein